MREKIPSEPTISVILPTQNRCWTLGRQISAIWPQIHADDQLIILANGCTDYTTQIVSLNSDWLWDYFVVHERLGVCGAYNMAASMARCDWILGANDHNELAPMALDAFRRMAVKHPTTRVMHGRIDAMPRWGWIDGGGYVPPASIPLIVSARQWITHGAETFIRRDSWGAGYRPELEWMADQEQSLTLAFRYGVVDIPALISHVEFRKGNYSQAHGDKDRFNRVIRAWRALIDTVEFEDVRDQYLLLHQLTGHFNTRA